MQERRLSIARLLVRRKRHTWLIYFSIFINEVYAEETALVIVRFLRVFVMMHSLVRVV